MPRQERRRMLYEIQNAEAIYPLIRIKKRSVWESIVDLITQPGVVHMLDYLQDSDAYYLVETEHKQLLVRVSKEFIMSSILTTHVDPKRFVIGTDIFKKATYRLI